MTLNIGTWRTENPARLREQLALLERGVREAERERVKADAALQALITSIVEPSILQSRLESALAKSRLVTRNNVNVFIPRPAQVMREDFARVSYTERYFAFAVATSAVKAALTGGPLGIRINSGTTAAPGAVWDITERTITMAELRAYRFTASVKLSTQADSRIIFGWRDGTGATPTNLGTPTNGVAVHFDGTSIVLQGRVASVTTSNVVVTPSAGAHLTLELYYDGANWVCDVWQYAATGSTWLASLATTTGLPTTGNYYPYFGIYRSGALTTNVELGTVYSFALESNF